MRYDAANRTVELVPGLERPEALAKGIRETLVGSTQTSGENRTILQS